MNVRKLLRSTILVVSLFLSAAIAFAQQPIRLRVDATEAPRRLYHAELVIPATPGPMDLFYPKWIPGEHAPSGPVTDLAGLKISAAGRTIEWKRDSVEMYAFHLTVPPGASALDVRLDFLSNSDAATLATGATATSELAILNWNQLIVYPRGKTSDEIQIATELRLPPDWKLG